MESPKFSAGVDQGIVADRAVPSLVTDSPFIVQLTYWRKRARGTVFHLTSSHFITEFIYYPCSIEYAAELPSGLGARNLWIMQPKSFFEPLTSDDGTYLVTVMDCGVYVPYAVLYSINAAFTYSNRCNKVSICVSS